MRKNFIIDQGIAIEFDGYYCDIHNEYDLTVLTIDYVQKIIIIIFERSQYFGVLAKVKTLELKAIGVDFLNVNFNLLDMSDEYVEEIGYKEYNDFEINYLIDDEHFKDSHHLVIYLGNKGFIRLHSSILTARRAE